MENQPRITGAPGLAWRKRNSGWVALWVARRDLAKRGFQPKTARLWCGAEPPDMATVEMIVAECRRLQDDMLAWGRGVMIKTAPRYNGTLSSLIDRYREDPQSDYQQLRFRSRKHYDAHLNAIDRIVGQRLVAKITGRDLKRWFDEWRVDPGGSVHVARAHARITHLRLLTSFGATILANTECEQLSTRLSMMRFEQPRPRTVRLTPDQADAICAKASELGFYSIALAQAFQTDLTLRPKDVIGEWVPVREPGMSSVIDGNDKWLYGLDWREIDEGFILSHRISKSLHGRDAIANPAAGRVMMWNLDLYPRLKREIARVPSSKRVGPMIVYERTGMPYRVNTFRHLWRSIATAAGVPANIQNRDSRAGGLTEVIIAGGTMDDARAAAGHTNASMTQRYIRAETEMTAKVARLRAKLHRPDGEQG